MIAALAQILAAALSRTETHDEYVELCAISTSGELSKAEQEKLQQHLATCASCRHVLKEYESITDQEIASIAALEVEDEQSIAPRPGWSQAHADKVFRERLTQQQDREDLRSEKGTVRQDFTSPILGSAEFAWNSMWLLYAAAAILLVASSVFLYRLGRRHGTATAGDSHPAISASQAPDQTALEAALSDASYEREIARSEIAQRDKTVAELRRQLRRQSSEIAQMKAASAALETELRNGSASNNDLVQQRVELNNKLEAAEASSGELEGKLNLLERQSADEAAIASASQAKVNDLTRLLEQRDSALQQQGELLAHDRDIRDVMGARDLYIAEVYDIAATGHTRKPFGRLFYTKGKSLIFYAYDLDPREQLKRANTFQAWGRRGPDRQNVINLGIFYEDNASRRRWILKCEDSATLAQIDAVFVTVEPDGGSDKPSSKPLLFAYLKVNPNHP